MQMLKFAIKSKISPVQIPEEYVSDKGKENFDDSIVRLSNWKLSFVSFRGGFSKGSPKTDNARVEASLQTIEAVMEDFPVKRTWKPLLPLQDESSNSSPRMRSFRANMFRRRPLETIWES